VLLSKSEISRRLNISRQAVDIYIKKHHIQPSGKKGKRDTFDTSTEPLASYFAGERTGNAGHGSKTRKPLLPVEPPKDSPPETESPAPEPSPASRAAKITKPLNDLLKGKAKGDKLSDLFYAESLEMARQSQDATLIFKLAQALEKDEKENNAKEQEQKADKAREKTAIAKAERLLIENDIKKGEYVKKDAVKLVLGKTYSVHTSALQPLGLKLASTINAIPPGPDREIKIRQFIDSEIYSALEMIQRTLMDFVGGKTI
jgi:hypothetical protein